MRYITNLFVNLQQIGVRMDISWTDISFNIQKNNYAKEFRFDI